MADIDMPPGHVGSLTPEEEVKLQQAWIRMGRICGTIKDSTGDLEEAAASGGADDPNDKYGQTKQFQQYVAEEKPENIRQACWRMVKLEHPDALMLRFLRARKWDVNKAVVMLVSTIQWRQQQRIEDDIIQLGEGVALKDPHPTKEDEYFLNQYRSRKAYMHGIDKEGRPIYYVKVRMHNQRAQSDASMERYILHTIESIRLLVRDPFDTACLIFDLHNFSLINNMDFPAVKFIIKVFEANYPESLGVICVHRAPWIFQGVWKLIRGWLDPVVASKVHFTNTSEDLQVFIDKDTLQKDYGGNDTWEYEYVEPVAGENTMLQDTEMRDRVLREREEIVKGFERLTAEWAREDPTSEKGQEINERRHDQAEALRKNNMKLDPYVRARNFYDRTGVLDAKGNVNFNDLEQRTSSSVSTATDGRVSEKSAVVETTHPIHLTGIAL